MNGRLLLLLGLVFFQLFETQSSRAQSSVSDSSISMFMIAPSYALQFPGGDMADRFGINNNVGLSFIWKRSSGWMFSLQGSFLFGNTIDEPGLFSMLTTSDGFIIGSDGLFADIRSFERGYYGVLSAGKLFPFKKPNPNSGLYVLLGAGYMQHWIRIEDKKNAVPSLQDDYLKGYDRLSGGLMIQESAGYLMTSNNRLVNFYVGVEMIQAFTRGMREYNFDQERPYTDQRLDLLFGLRVSWFMPLYSSAPDKFYIY